MSVRVRLLAAMLWAMRIIVWIMASSKDRLRPTARSQAILARFRANG